MKLPHRRQFLHLAAGVAALPVVSRIAWAQTYPTRPVRIVVGVAPGSVQDILARLIGQWLTERLGQPFVIDNRPGAATNIATEAVVRAPADGYTLLSMGPSASINATLYDKLNFNLIRDIAPVATLVHQSQLVLVNPSIPAKTLPEFLAYAKANPGKINMASSGIGTGNHMAGELFKMMAGVDLVHVPYRGTGPATTDLIVGQVQVMFTAPVGMLDYIKAGTLRALAVTTAKSEALPELPPVAAFVPGYESGVWFGIGAPKATPAAIVERLNQEINAGLADPK
jgi:tripartite-type tricarboxylate transporter receptor subunit TctC